MARVTNKEISKVAFKKVQSDLKQAKKELDEVMMQCVQYKEDLARLTKENSMIAEAMKEVIDKGEKLSKVTDLLFDHVHRGEMMEILSEYLELNELKD